MVHGDTLEIQKLTTNKMSEHCMTMTYISLHHPAQEVKEFYTFKNKKSPCMAVSVQQTQSI